jgi:hypothetical protein
MKKYSKPLIACLMGALVTLTGCIFAPDDLAAKPELLKDLNKTETRARLNSLDISTVELSCSPVAKKVVGEFKFVYLDGRKAVVVTGDTPCEKSGDLAKWATNELATRADYTAALLVGEVDKLLTKGKLVPAEGTLYNHEIGTAIMQKYQSVLPTDWRFMAFTCDDAGERYEYVAYNEGKKVASGSVKATCSAPNQNFAVNVVAAPEIVTKPVLLVRQFNGARPEALMSAFDELVGSRLPVTKF